MTKYEAETAGMLESVERLVVKLKARKKIPSGAKIERFQDQHIQPVFRLHAEFPANAATAWLRLQGMARTGNYSREFSLVLTLDGEVIGAFLVQPEVSPDTAYAYGAVIDSRWRGTWANALLKTEGFGRLLKAGYTRVQFQVEDSIHDSHKHAKRAGAKVVSTTR